MRVLVIGGGGREHALAWGLARSPSVRRVACAPGNSGIAEVADLVAIPADDVAALTEHAKQQRYDLIVVGPETPLVAGLADRLTDAGLRVFGCSARAAEIESSKRFAKQVMERAGVPTARWRAFRDGEAADRFIEELATHGRVVVKADGLAAGKGVVVCEGARQAKTAARGMLGGSLGAAGAEVVVEEFLVGREASCMAFVDGERVFPLAPCEDHKAAYDGDRGPMTGGMGAISPTPVADDELCERVAREILVPTARTLAEMGRPFRGLLYAGIMVTPEGPKVLEFNCRFGDPETQPIVRRFAGDLGEALLAVTEGRPPRIAFAPEAACAVVLAARGYPGPVERGAAIEGLAAASRLASITVFHAGTARRGERVVVAGGRVLTVTATGIDLAAARRRAYEAVGAIHFDGMHYRRDIGARGEGAKNG